MNYHPKRAGASRQPAGPSPPCRSRESRLYSLRVHNGAARMQENFDQLYIDELIAGSPSVQRHFTEYFGDLLFLKVRSQVRAAEIREDIVQETFLRVIKFLKHGHLDHPERLGAFVYRVCDNIVKEYFRKSGRDCPVPENYLDPPDLSADSESRMVTEQRRLQVKRLLDDMGEKDRLLLRAIFIEDRDKDEVCREMQVDRNYLRVLLHRAKARFRESMEKGGTKTMLSLFWG